MITAMRCYRTVCVADAGADAGGLLPNPRRGAADAARCDLCAVATGTAWRGLRLSAAASQYAFVSTTAGWSLGPRSIEAQISIAIRFPSSCWLPVSSAAPADYLPEGKSNLVLWLTEPFPEPVLTEAVELALKNSLKQQPEIADILPISSRSVLLVSRWLSEAAVAYGLSGMEER